MFDMEQTTMKNPIIRMGELSPESMDLDVEGFYLN